MRVYLIRRLIQIVPTILGITLVVFVMKQSIPGDPVVPLLGDAYTEEGAEKIRQIYGLDRPVHVQYLVWLGKLVRGDWGTSILTGTLFAVPGLGTFGIDAIIARDYQQVQGFALITALAFVAMNLLVDLTYTVLDPRIRYA